jgi:uncharacterized protein YceK
MRSTRLAWTVVAVLLALAGCSSTVSGTASPEGALPADPAAIVAAEEQASAGSTDSAVDVCALLSAADVAPVVGDGVEGRPSSGGGNCVWENRVDYHSVTVEIGPGGSAPGGALPPWDPSFGPEQALPDGMRSLGRGQLEFVAGDRDCHVQVATTDADFDEQKVAELARKVREQL